MDLALYLAFVAAVTLLIAIPGPNVALIVANSVAGGVRRGLLTVAGTSAAIALQLAIVAAGMTAFLGALASWFEWLRWLGVAYLVWLGIQAWRAPPTAHDPAPQTGRVLARGFLVSLTNPKTLVFLGAFLPQFVDPAGDAPRQLAVLALTMLAISLVLDSAWVLAAARAGALLRRHARARNRVTGGLLIGAGVGLALARR